MLAFEHPHRETLFQQSYSSASNIQAPYPGLEMDAFAFSQPTFNFHPLPFSYFEDPSLFAEAPAPVMKSHMSRSSDNALHMVPQHSYDVAPGLASSASSSTVGSPYSGPMHSDFQNADESSCDSDNFSQGLGLVPTIVHQDSYNREFGTGFDAELPIHDKITGNFVGESADLSSVQKRSSTFSYPINRNSQSASPAACLSYSPELLIADVHVSDASHTSSSLSVNRSRSLPVSVSHQQLPEPVFKSPSTPASAYPKTPSVHSPIERRLPAHGPQQHQQSHPMQQHGGPYQHHFFAQSSGNFMPPLETSCSFSLFQSTFPSLLFSVLCSLLTYHYNSKHSANPFRF